MRISFTPLAMLSLLAALGVACTDGSKDIAVDTGDGLVDADRDGFSEDEDCDDTDASIHPDADDAPYDGVDSNCDEAEEFDLDGDGFDGAADASGEDCDDADASVNPGADETCDGVDNNCDGLLDDSSSVDAGTWYADTDTDGFGDVLVSKIACDQPSGYVSDSTDCDDATGTVFPSADEYCNSIDDDCDGEVDEDDAVDAGTWYADTDNDGYGDPTDSTNACELPSGYLADDTDCDGSLGTVYPGADEYCDGTDYDCDGLTYEADSVDAPSWYTDGDGDGYGDPNSGVVACAQPTSTLPDGTDCDDTDSAVNPGAFEICNGGLDDDCDATTPEQDRVSTLDSAGVWTDNSSLFTGTASASMYLTVGSGTHYFCPGTYYVVFDILASTSLVGSSGSAADTVLDGVAMGDVLRIVSDGIDLNLQDITVQNGSGAIDSSGDALGGGLYCNSSGQSSTVTLDGVLFQDNAADDGGGLYVNGCDLEVNDSEIESNSAEFGGGLYAIDAAVTLNDSAVFENYAEGGGGGIYALNDSYMGSVMSVSLNDSWVLANDNDRGGAGATLSGNGGDVELTCTGSAPSAAGFLANETTDFYGGAVELYDGTGSAQLTSTLCSWGPRGDAGSDNTPDDIYTDNSAYTFAFGDDETFTCTADGCTPAHHVEHMGEGGISSITSSSYFEAFTANIYYNLTGTLLEEFSQYLDPTLACDFDLGVYSSSSGSGPWTQEALVTVTADAGADWVNSGTLNVSMTPGLYYLFGTHYVASDCGGYVYRYVEENNTEDPSFGLHYAHWYEWGVNGWTAPGSDMGYDDYSYMQNLYVLQ